MLTTSTYDPAIHGAPRCDGCGLPHLLLGGAVYTLPTPARRLLTIAQSCVFVESVRLTRIVCSALSSADFALLLAALCESEPTLEEAVRTPHKIVLVRPTTCGLCGTRLTGARKTTDDICNFCAAALRGW